MLLLLSNYIFWHSQLDDWSIQNALFSGFWVHCHDIKSLSFTWQLNCNEKKPLYIHFCPFKMQNIHYSSILNNNLGQFRLACGTIISLIIRKKKFLPLLPTIQSINHFRSTYTKTIAEILITKCDVNLKLIEWTCALRKSTETPFADAFFWPTVEKRCVLVRTVYTYFIHSHTCSSFTVNDLS